MLIGAFLAVVAVTVLIAVQFRSDLARARRNALSGSLIVETAAGPIEYADRGTGVPLLSIHGAGGGWDQGLANVNDLIRDDYRIIAPSRFGYLRTPVPRAPSPAAQADAHAALLAALDTPRAVVFGTSAGAQSAVELALRHPGCVAALVLIVPGTYTPTSPVAVDNSPGSRVVLRLVNVGADFFWWLGRKLAPSVLIRFIGVPPAVYQRASKAEQSRVLDIVRSVEPLSQRFRGIVLDSAPSLHPLPLERIAVPTLVVSARDDLFNTAPAAEFAARSIPGARLVIYESGGHLLVGRQEEMRALVREFLAPVRSTLRTPRKDSSGAEIRKSASTEVCA